jgi:hypothetical protein
MMAQRMSDQTDSPSLSDSGELVLALTSVPHLFNALPIDPLSPSAPEVLGVSGFDYLASLLRMEKGTRQARRLVLVLPADEPGLAAKIEQSLRRLAGKRIEAERRELKSTYRLGWKVMGMATLILAACIALSHLFASEYMAWLRPLLRTTLEYGFEIVGWVMLWYPIDVLGYAPLAIRHRIAALRKLASIEVAVRKSPRT